MNGVLVIDKPSGPTSHDVVARVRRAIGIDRIGHTGTLDPLATGVLPLVIGRATRLAQYLTAEEKEYVAGIRFGATSATYDALGSVTPSTERRTSTSRRPYWNRTRPLPRQLRTDAAAVLGKENWRHTSLPTSRGADSPSR